MDCAEGEVVVGGGGGAVLFLRQTCEPSLQFVRLYCSVPCKYFVVTFLSAVSRSKLQPKTPWPADVHPLPDPGAGERVQVQQVPHPQAEDRTLTHALLDGAPDKDMVPEPADEGEKRDSGNQGTERERAPREQQ